MRQFVEIKPVNSNTVVFVRVDSIAHVEQKADENTLVQFKGPFYDQCWKFLITAEPVQKLVQRIEQCYEPSAGIRLPEGPGSL